MNNYEKIKSMSIDEMADFLYQNLDNIIACETYKIRGGIYRFEKNIAKQWLESEEE